MKKQIFIFIGPPASGKGTQAEILEEKLKIPMISIGELLRHEKDNKSEIGRRIEDILSQGKLVSDDIVEEVLVKRLASKDVKNGFILDGYPRNESQLKHLEGRLNIIMGDGDELITIYVHTSDEEAIHRISGRRVCKCGEVYHIKTNPPKIENICDKCGEELHHREDDKPEVIKTRIEQFHKQVEPLLNYFKANSNFIEINGDQSIEEAAQEIWRKINK